MTGTLLSFSVMAISVRELAKGGFSIFEVLAIRSGAALLILGGLLAIRPRLFSLINTANLKMHLYRNVVHYGSQYFWATSLTMLPLATVFSLEFTMPAWAILLAPWFLKERLTPSRIGVVVLGLLGVLVIVRPGIATFNPGAILVLIAAFGYAITMVATKKLTTDETTFGILFWMTVIQLPIALASSRLSAFGDFNATLALPALSLGISGLSAHYCLANAFRAGDATVVVPMDFMRIPLIALVGWAFYQEQLDIFVFVGAGLIISGVLWNLRAESTASH